MRQEYLKCLKLVKIKTPFQPTPSVGFLFLRLTYNSNSNNNKTITMKYITLITLLLSLAFTGCQKQPSQDIDPITTTAALENSDNILSKYIEKLDSEFTTQEVRVKILCRDYPHEYKNNYMPNLLKLSPSEYSETVLLADMDLVLDHYKQTSNIQC